MPDILRGMRCRVLRIGPAGGSSQTSLNFGLKVKSVCTRGCITVTPATVGNVQFFILDRLRLPDNANRRTTNAGGIALGQAGERRDITQPACRSGVIQVRKNYRKRVASKSRNAACRGRGHRRCKVPRSSDQRRYTLCHARAVLNSRSYAAVHDGHCRGWYRPCCCWRN